ncbi:MAG: metallophosphatase family protein [Acidilobaceae archaeon]|nr:metallophosphatase family protein [Acidilobaceae archaeon]
MKALLISDIHGNLEALQAVLEHARGYDEVWVLGDLVDYGPNPAEVIDVVRGLSPDIALRGNHDEAVAFGVDCGCGEKTHWLSVYTREKVSMRLLGKEHISWLASLPLRAERELQRRVLLVHASPRNPLHDYLLPTLPPEELRRMLSVGLRGRLVSADLVVSGHTHVPADFRVEGIRVINPGSVGQPRDGDPRASYGLLDLESWEFRVFRVDYPREKTLEKLRPYIEDPKVYAKLAEILTIGRV